jgi:hypothetical protein
LFFFFYFLTKQALRDAQFKVQTEKDQAGLSEAYKRFKAAFPVKNFLGETLRKYIDDLKAAVDAVDKEMQAARAEAEEAGRAKWYCMVTTGA